MYLLNDISPGHKTYQTIHHAIVHTAALLVILLYVTAQVEGIEKLNRRIAIATA